MSTSKTITIDGAQGEGGGQILRTSLALSALTGTPIVIDNIRANRSRPGLLRQHLTGFSAVRDICQAEVEGCELGARRLSFRPGRPKGGSYHFAVTTAGSACLVLQTVLWPLLYADGPSRVVLEGGTHNSKSPPFEFIAEVFLPLLGRMGANVSVRLEAYGFYPAGGGRLVVDVEPCPKLQPLELLVGGAVRSRRARTVSSRLPNRIAKTELSIVRSRLGWRKDECRAEVVESRGPGNVLMLAVEREHVTELCTGFGERGVRAADVANRAAGEVERYLEADVPVGEHLADQLVIPLALAGKGAFLTLEPSLHTRTNLDVVEQILGVRPSLHQEAVDRVRVEL